MIQIIYKVADIDKARAELVHFGYIEVNGHFVKGNKAVYLVKRG